MDQKFFEWTLSMETGPQLTGSTDSTVIDSFSLDPSANHRSEVQPMGCRRGKTNVAQQYATQNIGSSSP